MNYQKHYTNLIISRKDQTIHPDEYYEIHHILPKCMGGDDSPENLITLTPEEHYVAHLLLAKIHNIDSLWFACVMMCTGLNKRNNKLYGWVRRAANKHHSIRVKDAWAVKRGFNDYAHQAEVIWDLYVNQNNHTMTISEQFNIPQGNIWKTLRYQETILLDTTSLEEVKFKQRSALSTRIRNAFTPEQEDRRRAARSAAGYEGHQRGEARSGVNNPAYGKNWSHTKEICPHCNKSVGGKRWHFNNCKERKDEN